MRTTFAAQLAQLELGALTLKAGDQAPAGELPSGEACEQVLAAIWSDLFELFPDTALEEDSEEIAWGLVNLFHRAAQKRSGQLDRATDQVRLLVAANDGSEVHASELETQIERAQAAERAMIGLEQLREIAAALYLHETGSSWRPAAGSRLNHSRHLTSAVVDGRSFLRARAESRRKAAQPDGTPVLFAGGRLEFVSSADAAAFAGNLFKTLDRVRQAVGDPILIHGGDRNGADRLAASWAEQRKIPQLVFSLDRKLGRRAGFRRNEQMLALEPRYVIAFPGSGVVERLVIDAKARGLAVVDRRGPLGTNPKFAARSAPSTG